MYREIKLRGMIKKHVLSNDEVKNAADEKMGKKSGWDNIIETI